MTSSEMADTHAPQSAKRFVIMSLMISIMFLVSLDRTIIGVAIPTITDEFGSIDDIGWYGSAFMMANASLQLLFGRIYKFAPVKITFIASIIVFEIGSAVCGAAPSSTALIIGRAIAGSGAAGIFSGAMQIMLAIIPLKDRPMWQALFAMVMGVSSALGPLIGGAFTSKVSWRWCFYINLPLGAVVVVAMMLLLHVDERKASDKPAKSACDTFLDLDPVGFLLLVPSIICLLLALQYGGFTYPWSDGRVIALLVLFGVLLLAFIASQYYFQERALLPPRVFLQKSVQGAFWYVFLLSGSMTIMIYYIPIWFQVVKGSPALHSSYQTLASILPLVFSAILAGALAKKVGYYAPQMMCAPIIASMGAGLMTTWTVSTPESAWIGYQFLYGFGIGLGMQGPNLSVQTVLVKADMPIGVASVFFAQQVGAAIWVSIAENLLANKLASGLAHIQSIDPRALANMGATQVRTAVSPSELPLVLSAYNAALRTVWIAALVLICLLVLPFTQIEWRNIKKPQPGNEHEGKRMESKGQNDAEKQAEKEETHEKESNEQDLSSSSLDSAAKA